MAPLHIKAAFDNTTWYYQKIIQLQVVHAMNIYIYMYIYIIYIYIYIYIYTFIYLYIDLQKHFYDVSFLDS